MSARWTPKTGFHRALEISRRARDSHIPTADDREGRSANEQNGRGEQESTNRSRPPRPWWPVLKCRSVAGFQMSAEGLNCHARAVGLTDSVAHRRIPVRY